MADDSIKIDEHQRSVLLPQIDAFLRAAPDDAAREPYVALKSAIVRGEVPADLADRLGAIIELLMTSGRARAAHGPAAQLSLWSLFQKTPRGTALLHSIAGVNQALKRVVGHQLQFVDIVARGPGAVSLTLKSDTMQMVVRFDQDGVRIESIELGD